MATAKVVQVQLLRRSGAAGPHRTPKDKPRAQRERDARNEQENNQ